MSNFLEGVGTLRAGVPARRYQRSVAARLRPHGDPATPETAMLKQTATATSQPKATQTSGRARPRIRQPVKQGQSPSRPPTAHP